MGNWPGSSAAHVGRTIRDATNMSKRQLIRPSFLLPIELLRTQENICVAYALESIVLHSTVVQCTLVRHVHALEFLNIYSS